MADEIHTVVYSDWRDDPEFQRLRQAWYAVECEDKRLIAEKAVRIAELEADNGRLRREAAEWTEMLARDGIRFEEQPVMDPVPPLYFWLGRDADWPVVERMTLARDWNYKHIAVGVCSLHGHYASEDGCPGCNAARSR